MNRRQALAGFGGVSLAALVAACGDDGDSKRVETTDGTQATVEPQGSSGGLAAKFDDAATCRQTAELTEGPYYFDVDRVRRDIREDRKGARLRLGVRVRDAAACRPISDAVVDIWHCDALGSYSGYESASQGAGGGGGQSGAPPPPGGPPGGGGGGGGNSGPTDDETYLRGAQVTNEDGIVQFITVYPGWYTGRTVHIHAKVHIDRQTVLTTQFNFDDDFTAKVFKATPYASDRGRDTFNDDDNLYRKDLELTLSEESGGYLGLITLDVDRA